MNDAEFIGRLIVAAGSIFSVLGVIIGWSYKHITKPINECTTELKLFHNELETLKLLQDKDKETIKEEIKRLDQEIEKNKKDIENLKDLIRNMN